MKVEYSYLSKEEVDSIYDWFRDLNIRSPDWIYPLMEKNPIFFLKTICNNRDKVKSITGLIFLSMSDKQYCKTIFLKNFTKIITNIKELIIFLDKINYLRGTGKVIKRAINSWFRSRSLSELKKEFQSNIGNTSWRNIDILHLFHIKPWNMEVSNYFKSIVEIEKAIDKDLKK